MAAQPFLNKKSSFDSLIVGSGSRPRDIPFKTTNGSESIYYQPRVNNHQAIASSAPGITVTSYDVTANNAPTVRRKTWPSSKNSTYKRKRGFFSSAKEDSEKVTNIYFEHPDNLQADFRARTDLDTKNDAEDLYIPRQEADIEWHTMPSTPFLKDEFNAGTTQGVEAFMKAFMNETSKSGTYKNDMCWNVNVLPFVVDTREVVW